MISKTFATTISALMSLSWASETYYAGCQFNVIQADSNLHGVLIAKQKRNVVKYNMRVTGFEANEDLFMQTWSTEENGFYNP